MTEETRNDETLEQTGEGEATAVAEEPAVKLQQEVEMKDIGPCKKHIKVSISREDIDRLLNAKYSELVTDSNVAGFRPGKAPRRIVERRFQKEVFAQLRGEILMQSLEQLADDHDVAPISPPNINADRIVVPDSGPMVYEFDVEVRPAFDLPNYRGLKLRRLRQEITEEQVDLDQKRVLEPYGQLVPKSEGTVELGDTITVDLTTQYDGREVGKLTEVNLRVEPRLALKDGIAEHFGEQVKGAKVGETKQIEIVLSEAAADPALRGKTVTSAMAIKDIKTLRLPELTPDILGEFGVQTEEQLRERIRAALSRRHEYQQRQYSREQVLELLSGATQWELPQDLLVRQARRALSRRIMEMRSAGISDQEIAGRQRVLEQDIIRSTAKSLKEHFVLQKIAELEKLDVDEEDLDAEIERIAAQNDESPRRLRARFEKEDALDVLATELIERMALDLILESAQYEDIESTGQAQEGAVGTLEEQAVPGEMHDPTAIPPEEVEEEGAAKEDKPA